MSRRVYPRVCGGTGCAPRTENQARGLSPRVRGNRNPTWARPEAVRSIPACAGEPSAGQRTGRWTGVYPRVCGGTKTGCELVSPTAGLSPRVRGNPREGVVRSRRIGSIPACAGEPCMPMLSIGTLRVYPRVCGGTGNSGGYKIVVPGLSPRVRGNRCHPMRMLERRRSIPACAGEPRDDWDGVYGLTVYPRVCGGTGRLGEPATTGCGLSPRVRGNPTQLPLVDAPTRSIPACAGEPSRYPTGMMMSAVYPRVCGGTLQALRIPASQHGLSPRVRGNPHRSGSRWKESGSIPACAGEPHGSAPYW